MAGHSRERLYAGSEMVTAVWTSEDGKTWQPAQGEFDASQSDDTRASDICPLPGGDVLLVGGTEVDGQDHPVAWRLSGGTWNRVDDAALGNVVGTFTSCATDGAVTVIQGTAQGRATLWRTADGARFDAIQLGKRGDSFGPVHAVEGGFAAAGAQDAPSRSGAVVWLSKDSEVWRAVPVPSKRPLTGVDLVERDGGLIVAASSATPPELWRLDNPLEVLDS